MTTPSLDYRAPREPLVSPGGVEIFARDMTVTVAADVPLQVLQEKLAEAGQWLPIDGDPALPVGELVEINSTGPLRLGYGAWRDLLLGCQFTNRRGELITAGGRTVKNVAGYDLTKFMVGQQGFFGKVVTITTRTYKRPAGGLVVEHEPNVRRLNALLATPMRPQWAILRPERLLLGYLGDEAALDFWHSKIVDRESASRRSLDADLEDRRRLFSRAHETGVTFRASLPPGRIAEFIAATNLNDWSADAAFGIVRASCAEEGELPALRESARTAGGSLWRERGANIDGAVYDPVQRALLHRLRDAFT